MELKPLADRVLIKPAPAEEVTASGIIIPDSAKEKPLKGIVSLSATEQKTRKWFSNPETTYSTANMPALKSISVMAKKDLSCAKTKYSPLYSDIIRIYTCFKIYNYG